MSRHLLSAALRRDEHGVAATELALSFSILSILIMGITDASSIFSHRLSLEQGAQRAIEKVLQTTELDSIEDTIKKEVNAQTGVATDRVTVTNRLWCDGVEHAATTDCTGTQREMRYIIVDVWDDYDPMFASLSLGTKTAEGKYRVAVRTGLRTI